MLIFFAWSFILPGLSDHEFREVAVAYVLGGPLGEEVDVVLVVFELFFLLQLLFFFLVLDAKFFVVSIAPFVGIDIFVVLFDPSQCLLLGYFYPFTLDTLHHY